MDYLTELLQKPVLKIRSALTAELEPQSSDSTGCVNMTVKLFCGQRNSCSLGRECLFCVLCLIGRGEASQQKMI